MHAPGKVNPRETEQVDLELIDNYPGVAKSVQVEKLCDMQCGSDDLWV